MGKPSQAKLRSGPGHDADGYRQRASGAVGETAAAQDFLEAADRRDWSRLTTTEIHLC
ncbi:MAG: hypothetical protein WA820_07150 [Bradyrhizobium sp.]